MKIPISLCKNLLLSQFISSKYCLRLWILFNDHSFFFSEIWRLLIGNFLLEGYNFFFKFVVPHTLLENLCQVYVNKVNVNKCGHLPSEESDKKDVLSTLSYIELGNWHTNGWHTKQILESPKVATHWRYPVPQKYSPSQKYSHSQKYQINWWNA